MVQWKLSANRRSYRQTTALDAQLSFKNFRQGFQAEEHRHGLQNLSCPKVSRKSVLPNNRRQTQPTKFLLPASSEWHKYNHQGELCQNSLDAAFSTRQCDYSVEIRVSYFYHISSKSGFESIHREVIASHFREKPARRLWDRKIEGCHEPHGLYHNRRGVRLRDWNVWD